MMTNSQECLTWRKDSVEQLLRRPKRIPCTCPLCVRNEGVTVDGKKQHICDYKNCNKLFSTSYHLRNHMRSHLGMRPYSCSFCEKRFFRSEELTRHKRSHTKEKIYICPQCTKGFTRSDYLSKHIDMHTRRALEMEQKGESIPTVSHPECNKNEDNLTVNKNNSLYNELSISTEYLQKMSKVN